MLSGSLKNSDITKILTSQLLANEVIILLTVAKELHQTLNIQLGSILPIKWLYYNLYQNKNSSTEKPDDPNLIHKAVRDYLIIKYIKDNTENVLKINFQAMLHICSTLSITKYIIESEEINSLPRVIYNSLEWTSILNAVSNYNESTHKESELQLTQHLKKLATANSALALQKLTTLVADKTHIVVTLNNMDLAPQNNTTQNTLMNFFQTKSRPRFHQKGSDEHNKYFSERIVTELLHYLNASVHELQALMANPHAHPCYGTLQFFNCISPITTYGENFVMMQPAVKQYATASFGAPLNRIMATGIRLKPVRLSDSITPLIAQFSDELLAACLRSDQNFHFPRDFDMQSHKDNQLKTQYIEVQLPPNLQLDDASIIRHIHFSMNSKHPPLALQDSLMKAGIHLSFGPNPFESIEYAEAFQNNNLNQLLTFTIGNYIHKTALLVGETNGLQLGFINDGKQLQYTFRITQNSPAFHQAQAAAILYTMGAWQYFETHSAIDLKTEDQDGVFTYKIPLNGIPRSDGDLSDHDAYTHDYYSLNNLLNKFLNRAFSIYLGSLQNEEYLLQHNRPHPITGKGITEESNLTKEFMLSINENVYAIEVKWQYDSTLMQIQSASKSSIDYVHDKLATLFKTNISLHESTLLITMPLPRILDILEQNKKPYQATVIFDDAPTHYGNILLAYRYGFATPGGHNNDPYSWVGAFTDIEFGKVIDDWDKINISKKNIGSTTNPTTAYYSLPASCLRVLKEDTAEFLSNSLLNIPVYQLGNLSPEDKSSAIEALNTTLDAFNTTFNNSLPLRPLPSLLIYIADCKQLLTELINRLFHNIPQQLLVNIDCGIDGVKFNDGEYWKPKPSFGTIEICGDKHYLSLLKKYYDSYSQLSINVLTESSLIFTSANPQKLINATQQAPHDFSRHDRILIEDLLIKLNNNSIAYLTQFTPTVIATLLNVATEHGYSLESIQPSGYEIAAILFKEWQSFLARTGLTDELCTENVAIPPEYTTLRYILAELLCVNNNSNILHFAAQNGHMPIITGLVNAGIDVDAPCADGCTALHIAVIYNQFDAVKYLVKQGKASTNIKDDSGNLPIHYAAKYNHSKIFNYFLTISTKLLMEKNSDGITGFDLQLKNETSFGALNLCFLKAMLACSNNEKHTISPEALQLQLATEIKNNIPNITLEDVQKFTQLQIMFGSFMDKFKQTPAAPESTTMIIKRKALQLLSYPHKTKKTIHTQLCRLGFFGTFKDSIETKKASFRAACTVETRAEYRNYMSRLLRMNK